MPMVRSPLSRPAARAGRDRYIPRLTALESRDMPSTCVVNNLGDAGVGTAADRGDLRFCVDFANRHAGSDTISISVTGTIALKKALPPIEGDLDIVGPGAGLFTVDGGNQFRVFFVSQGATVGISGLTVADGLTTGTVVGSTVFSDGGAVYNAGTLTLTQVAVSNSKAYAFWDNQFHCCKNTLSRGGGIYNDGVLTVGYSTIARNSVVGSDWLYYTDQEFGAGIYNAGVVTLDHSAVLSNTGDGWGGVYGGGVYNAGTIRIGDSTIAGNAAGIKGIFNDGAGGGIYGETQLIANSTIAGNTAVDGAPGGGIVGNVDQMLDTIVADNSAGKCADLDGALASSSHNLFGNSACGSGYAGSDLLDIDPKLDSIRENGGPTETMALLPGSPAIDSGDNANAPPYDQRGPGYPRIVNGTIDRGAFEVQNTAGPAGGRSALVTAPVTSSLPLRSPPLTPAGPNRTQRATSPTSVAVPIRTKAPVAANSHSVHSPLGAQDPDADPFAPGWLRTPMPAS
jgi:hypothetical protein